MSKSIAMMADEILGGALTNTADSLSEVVGATHFPSPEKGELPPISDESRNQLLESAMLGMGVLDELDLSKPSETSPETQKKKAEWEEKNRNRRKVQSQAHSRYPRTNADSNSGPDSAHQKGRGQKAGQPRHVDTRRQGSASGDNSSTWRKEFSKAKDPKKHGSSQIIIPGKGGQKYAKSAHADALKRSREQGKSGITKIEGVQIVKTNKTMTLIDASSHRERIANKKLASGTTMTPAEKAQKRKTYKRKPGKLDSDAAKHGSSVVGQSYESKKPSAGLSDKKKKATAKKARKGGDIGKKGKNFDKVADDAAEEYGSKEAGEKVAAAAMWKNMKKEQRETIRKARAILDEMTAVGGIGVGKMGGSANKAYDDDGKPMGEDGVKIEPVDKSMKKLDNSKSKKKPAKKKAAKKKEVSVKKESFENFLNLIINETQK